MSDIWFYSDPHFFHKNCLGFKKDDGISPMRPEFAPKDMTDPVEVSKCLKLMNETIISNINAKVKVQDKLYCLGDVTFYYGEAFKLLYDKIDSKKNRLLIGNHDEVLKLTEARVFKKINLWRVFRDRDFVAAHVPVKKDSLKTNFNVHGHVHWRDVLNEDGTPDLHYINVCVEHTNYSPIHIDEISAEITRRKKILDIE